MRVAVFLEEDYTFTFGMLEALIPRLRSGHEVAGVVAFPNRLTRHQGIGIYRKYVEVFGFAVFMRLACKTIAGRLRRLSNVILGKSACWTFAGLCTSRGVPYLHSRDPNGEEVVAWVKDRRVDVVLAFVGYILKQHILAAPRVCVINKHAAILPASRGVFPVFWSLLHDEPVGVTIHKVDERIDAGEIVLQKVYEKRKDWSVWDYYQLVYSEAPDLIVESLALLESGGRRPVADRPSPSYRGLPTRQDYLEFRGRGFSFV
ncbi:MAG: hypothetical protein HY748_11090 [Elusimicrobia bacterium]|nr:hypothetical protein [Elusimicrobiota bacterium]